MTPAEQAEILNRFPEVVWDRTAGTDEYRATYGWINRADGRADFLAVFFWDYDDGNPPGVSHLTSSAELSAEISLRLGEDEHFDCVKVADHYGDLVPRKITPHRGLDAALLGQ